MGLGIYIYEVVSKWNIKEKHIKDIHKSPQLQKKFKDKIFLKKYLRYKIKVPFARRKLNHKDWDYSSTTDDNLDIFINKKDNSELKIPLSEFPIGYKKYPSIRIREIHRISGYMIGIYSAWFNIYDYLYDNHPKIFYRWLFLMNRKEIEKFINTFCKNKEIATAFFNKIDTYNNFFIWFCW